MAQQPGAVRRVLCGTLAVAMLLTALPATPSAWADASAGVPLAVPHLPNTGPGALDLASLSIPESLGYVVETWQPSGEAPTGFVIHLQDLHVHPEAQEHLSELIGHLHDRLGIQLVGVEGAEGACDTELYASLPDPPSTERIARLFRQEGLFTGAEYYAIAHPGTVNLWGVEDEALYLEHLSTYQEGAAQRDEAEATIGKLRDALLPLKKTLYPKTMQRLSALREAYEQDKPNAFESYLKELVRLAQTRGADSRLKTQDSRDKSTADLREYPNIRAALKAYELYPRIDMRQVEEERRQLLAALWPLVTSDDHQRLTTFADRASTSPIAAMRYHAALLQLARANGLLDDHGAYRTFRQYARYVKLSQQLRSTALLDELRELEQAVEEAYLKTEQQRTFARFLRQVELLDHLIHVTLSPRDLSDYRAVRASLSAEGLWRELGAVHSPQSIVHRQELGDLVANLSGYEKFYELAIKRDEALVTNLLRKMRDDGASTAVLIAGGFHTPGLTARLKASNLAYAVIAPKVDGELDEKVYDERLHNVIPSVQELSEKLDHFALGVPLGTAESSTQTTDFRLGRPSGAPDQPESVHQLSKRDATLVSFLSLKIRDWAQQGRETLATFIPQMRIWIAEHQAQAALQSLAITWESGKVILSAMGMDIPFDDHGTLLAMGVGGMIPGGAQEGTPEKREPVPSSPSSIQTIIDEALKQVASKSARDQLEGWNTLIRAAATTGDAHALQALITLLSHSDPELRRRAAEALGRMGPAAASAVPALTKALENEPTDPRLRWRAAEALGGMGLPASQEERSALLTRFEKAPSVMDAYTLGQLAMSDPAVDVAAQEALITAWNQAPETADPDQTEHDLLTLWWVLRTPAIRDYAATHVTPAATEQPIYGARPVGAELEPSEKPEDEWLEFPIGPSPSKAAYQGLVRTVQAWMKPVLDWVDRDQAASFHLNFALRAEEDRRIRQETLALLKQLTWLLMAPNSALDRHAYHDIGNGARAVFDVKTENLTPMEGFAAVSRLHVPWGALGRAEDAAYFTEVILDGISWAIAQDAATLREVIAQLLAVYHRHYPVLAIRPFLQPLLADLNDAEFRQARKEFAAIAPALRQAIQTIMAERLRRASQRDGHPSPDQGTRGRTGAGRLVSVLAALAVPALLLVGYAAFRLMSGVEGPTELTSGTMQPTTTLAASSLLGFALLPASFLKPLWAGITRWWAWGQTSGRSGDQEIGQTGTGSDGMTDEQEALSGARGSAGSGLPRSGTSWPGQSPQLPLNLPSDHSPVSSSSTASQTPTINNTSTITPTVIKKTPRDVPESRKRYSPPNAAATSTTIKFFANELMNRWRAFVSTWPRVAIPTGSVARPDRTVNVDAVRAWVNAQPVWLVGVWTLTAFWYAALAILPLYGVELLSSAADGTVLAMAGITGGMGASGEQRPSRFREIPGIPSVEDLLEVLARENVVVHSQAKPGGWAFALLLALEGGEEPLEKYVRRLQLERPFAMEEQEYWRKRAHYGKTLKRINPPVLRAIAHYANLSLSDILRELGLSGGKNKMVVISAYSPTPHEVLFEEAMHILAGNPEIMDSLTAVKGEEAITDVLQLMFWPSDQLGRFASPYVDWSVDEKVALQQRYLRGGAVNPNVGLRPVIEALLDDLENDREVRIGRRSLSIFDLVFRKQLSGGRSLQAAFMEARNRAKLELSMPEYLESLLKTEQFSAHVKKHGKVFPHWVPHKRRFDERPRGEGRTGGAGTIISMLAALALLLLATPAVADGWKASGFGQERQEIRIAGDQEIRESGEQGIGISGEQGSGGQEALSGGVVPQPGPGQTQSPSPAPTPRESDKSPTSYSSLRFGQMAMARMNNTITTTVTTALTWVVSCMKIFPAIAPPTAIWTSVVNVLAIRSRRPLLKNPRISPSTITDTPDAVKETVLHKQSRSVRTWLNAQPVWYVSLWTLAALWYAARAILPLYGVDLPFGATPDGTVLAMATIAPTSEPEGQGGRHPEKLEDVTEFPLQGLGAKARDDIAAAALDLARQLHDGAFDFIMMSGSSVEPTKRMVEAAWKTRYPHESTPVILHFDSFSESATLYKQEFHDFGTSDPGERAPYIQRMIRDKWPQYADELPRSKIVFLDDYVVQGKKVRSVEKFLKGAGYSNLRFAFMAGSSGGVDLPEDVMVSSNNPGAMGVLVDTINSVASGSTDSVRTQRDLDAFVGSVMARIRSNVQDGTDAAGWEASGLGQTRQEIKLTGDQSKAEVGSWKWEVESEGTENQGIRGQEILTGGSGGAGGIAPTQTTPQPTRPASTPLARATSYPSHSPSFGYITKASSAVAAATAHKTIFHWVDTWAKKLLAYAAATSTFKISKSVFETIRRLASDHAVVALITLSIAGLPLLVNATLIALGLPTFDAADGTLLASLDPTRDAALSGIQGAAMAVGGGAMSGGQRDDREASVTDFSDTVQQLASPSGMDKLHAFNVLVRAAMDFPTARQALTTALRDPDSGVRASAAWALGQLGPHAAPAVPVLTTTALEDSDSSVRHAAARALGWLGPHAAPAVPVLTTALEDSDSSVRHAAARALDQLGGGKDPAVLSTLTAAVTNPATPWDVRHAAARALGQLGAATPAILTALTRAVTTDGDPDIRHAAAWALDQLGGGKDPAVLSTLTAAVTNPATPWDVRHAAAWALIQLGQTLPAVSEDVPERLLKELAQTPSLEAAYLLGVLSLTEPSIYLKAADVFINQWQDAASDKDQQAALDRWWALAAPRSHRAAVLGVTPDAPGQRFFGERPIGLELEPDEEEHFEFSIGPTRSAAAVQAWLTFTQDLVRPVLDIAARDQAKSLHLSFALTQPEDARIQHETLALLKQLSWLLMAPNHALDRHAYLDVGNGARAAFEIKSDVTPVEGFAAVSRLHVPWGALGRMEDLTYFTNVAMDGISWAIPQEAATLRSLIRELLDVYNRRYPALADRQIIQPWLASLRDANHNDEFHEVRREFSEIAPVLRDDIRRIMARHLGAASEATLAVAPTLATPATRQWTKERLQRLGWTQPPELAVRVIAALAVAPLREFFELFRGEAFLRQHEGPRGLRGIGLLLIYTGMFIAAVFGFLDTAGAHTITRLAASVGLAAVANPVLHVLWNLAAIWVRQELATGDAVDWRLVSRVLADARHAAGDLSNRWVAFPAMAAQMQPVVGDLPSLASIEELSRVLEEADRRSDAGAVRASVEQLLGRLPSKEVLSRVWQRMPLQEAVDESDELLAASLTISITIASVNAMRHNLALALAALSPPSSAPAAATAAETDAEALQRQAVGAETLTTNGQRARALFPAAVWSGRTISAGDIAQGRVEFVQFKPEAFARITPEAADRLLHSTAQVIKGTDAINGGRGVRVEDIIGRQATIASLTNTTYAEVLQAFFTAAGYERVYQGPAQSFDGAEAFYQPSLSNRPSVLAMTVAYYRRPDHLVVPTVLFRAEGQAVTLLRDALGHWNGREEGTVRQLLGVEAEQHGEMVLAKNYLHASDEPQQVGREIRLRFDEQARATFYPEGEPLNVFESAARPSAGEGVPSERERVEGPPVREDVPTSSLSGPVRSYVAAGKVVTTISLPALPNETAYLIQAEEGHYVLYTAASDLLAEITLADDDATRSLNANKLEVPPTLRGRGYARAMLAWAQTEARRRYPDTPKPLVLNLIQNMAMVPLALELFEPGSVESYDSSTGTWTSLQQLPSDLEVWTNDFLRRYGSFTVRRAGGEGYTVEGVPAGISVRIEGFKVSAYDKATGKRLTVRPTHRFSLRGAPRTSAARPSAGEGVPSETRGRAEGPPAGDAARPVSRSAARLEALTANQLADPRRRAEIDGLLRQLHRAPLPPVTVADIHLDDVHPQCSFVARDPDSGAIVGIAISRRASEISGALSLQWLAVAASRTREGIGRWLMEAVRQAAARAGYRAVMWDVRQDDPGAIRFYDALGTERVGPTPILSAATPMWRYLLPTSRPVVQLFPESILLDVGTGAGEMALALATQHPQARVITLDPKPRLRSGFSLPANVALVRESVQSWDADGLTGRVDQVVWLFPNDLEEGGSWDAVAVKLAGLLKPGGQLTMVIEGGDNWTEPLARFEKGLAASGLRIEKTSGIPFRELWKYEPLVQQSGLYGAALWVANPTLSNSTSCVVLRAFKLAVASVPAAAPAEPSEPGPGMVGMGGAAADEDFGRRHQGAKVGEIIEDGGKRFKVVALEEDRAPVVEEIISTAPPAASAATAAAGASARTAAWPLQPVPLEVSLEGATRAGEADHKPYYPIYELLDRRLVVEKPAITITSALRARAAYVLACRLGYAGVNPVQLAFHPGDAGTVVSRVETYFGRAIESVLTTSEARQTFENAVETRPPYSGIVDAYHALAVRFGVSFVEADLFRIFFGAWDSYLLEQWRIQETAGGTPDVRWIDYDVGFSGTTSNLRAYVTARWVDLLAHGRSMLERLASLSDADLEAVAAEAYGEPARAFFERHPEAGVTEANLTSGQGLLRLSLQYRRDVFRHIWSEMMSRSGAENPRVLRSPTAGERIGTIDVRALAGGARRRFAIRPSSDTSVSFMATGYQEASYAARRLQAALGRIVDKILASTTEDLVLEVDRQPAGTTLSFQVNDREAVGWYEDRLEKSKQAIALAGGFLSVERRGGGNKGVGIIRVYFPRQPIIQMQTWFGLAEIKRWNRAASRLGAEGSQLRGLTAQHQMYTFQFERMIPYLPPGFQPRRVALLGLYHNVADLVGLLRAFKGVEEIHLIDVDVNSRVFFDLERALERAQADGISLPRIYGARTTVTHLPDEVRGLDLVMDKYVFAEAYFSEGQYIASGREIHRALRPGGVHVTAGSAEQFPGRYKAAGMRQVDTELDFTLFIRESDLASPNISGESGTESGPIGGRASNTSSTVGERLGADPVTASATAGDRGRNRPGRWHDVRRAGEGVPSERERVEGPPAGGAVTDAEQAIRSRHETQRDE